MVFSIDHWRDPRGTIANKFQKNDIEYATHGAIVAAEGLRILDNRPSESRAKTLLDMGCGTGRVARVLSHFFGRVYAYDPVVECTQLAATECSGLQFHNLQVTSRWEDIPEVDLGFSANVIEHLGNDDAQVFINRLIEKVRGPTVLWYSTSKNAEILAPYLNPEQKAEDALCGGFITVRLVDFRAKCC